MIVYVAVDGCTIQFDFLGKSDILVLIKEIEILLKNMEDFYEKNKTHLRYAWNGRSCVKTATVFGQKNKNFMTFHAEIPEALYGEMYPSEM